MIKYIIAIAVLWFLYRISTKKDEKIVEEQQVEQEEIVKVLRKATLSGKINKLINS